MLRFRRHLCLIADISSKGEKILKESYLHWPKEIPVRNANNPYGNTMIYMPALIADPVPAWRRRSREITSSFMQWHVLNARNRQVNSEKSTTDLCAKIPATEKKLIIYPVSLSTVPSKSIY